jgi:hypothetical protein
MCAVEAQILRGHFNDFIQSNAPIYLTSLVYLCWMKPRWIHMGSWDEIPPQGIALFGAIEFLLVGEALARRYQWAQKFSVNTFLHEGAHWIVAKALGLAPRWRLGQPYVTFSGRPQKRWQNSVLSLAPMMIWWLGLLVAFYFEPSSQPIHATLAIAVMVLFTLLGTPSDDPANDCSSDWESARLRGSPRMNVALVGVGIVIVAAALIRAV